jgi:hypothetical protein
MEGRRNTQPNDDYIGQPERNRLAISNQDAWAVTAGSKEKRMTNLKKRGLSSAFTFIAVLAVVIAMVACQGPAGPAGAKGDSGTMGAAGPQGPSGTTDNSSPMLKKPIPVVYLALTGSGAKRSGIVALNSYLEDAESPSVTFGTTPAPTSSDATVATAAVTEAGRLTVTAKGSGTATITVLAYDGVNAAVPVGVSVEVAQSNQRPTSVTLTDADVAKLGKDKLYMVSGVQSFEVTSRLTPGRADAAVTDSIATFGVEIYDETMINGEAATLAQITAASASAADDRVSVTVTAGSKTNSYIIAVTPLKPGIKQTVVIKPKDIFGISVLAAQAWKFSAEVNKPPVLLSEIPDKTLYRGGTSPKIEAFTYVLTDYFVDLESTEAVDDDDDTSCVFETTPHQSNDTVLDPVTAATRASVVGTLANGNALDLGRAIEAVAVMSNAMATTGATAGRPSADAAGYGTFDLTISCWDADATVETSATITVFAANN